LADRGITAAPIMTELSRIFGNQLVFGAFVGVFLLALAEGGYRMGMRLFKTRDEARRSQIGGVQGAVLGLLGLLLGFTFSMAVGRYETRRDLVLKESNAIGTAWLRANLLPEAHQAPAKTLFREYVDTRINYQKLGYDPAQLAEGLRRSAEIESALWKHAEASAREAPTAITGSFVTALNDMIDTAAERIAAHRNRIPEVVWVLLMLVAACGCITSSYGSGAHGARSAFTGFVLPLLITVVIVLIYDILHTHQGFVSISQQPMLDLQQSMQAEVAK
jgi:hypothetical protein